MGMGGVNRNCVKMSHGSSLKPLELWLDAAVAEGTNKTDTEFATRLGQFNIIIAFPTELRFLEGLINPQRALQLVTVSF